MGKISALVLLVPVAVLAASCLAEVSDDEPIGAAGEPGILLNNGLKQHPPLDPVTGAHLFLEQHHDECAQACYDVWAGLCSPCNADDDYESHCGGVTLSCEAAEDAWRGEAEGIAMCWRDCLHLH